MAGELLIIDAFGVGVIAHGANALDDREADQIQAVLGLVEAIDRGVAAGSTDLDANVVLGRSLVLGVSVSGAEVYISTCVIGMAFPAFVGRSKGRKLNNR